MLMTATVRVACKFNFIIHLFMTLHCLNCGTQLADQYCPHCGQKATVKRLSWHY